MSDRLQELKSAGERSIIGLNCGTSLDGIDTAVLRVSGSGTGARFRVMDFFTHPLDSRLAERLLRMLEQGSADLCDLNFAIAEAFAAAALEGMRRTEIARGDPCLIGSHGITIFHRPPRRTGEMGATLQLGDISVIAERTGAVVVGDFRTADMAAGGQGAPLMPYLDYLLFHDAPGTIVLNLGGIANLTYVAAAVEDVRAFDTGPANLPLNHVMRRLSRGTRDFDDGGREAALGHVDSTLLDRLMSLPYIQAAPPKTTGREEFGEAWTEKLLATHGHLKLTDILATLTAFTARGVKFAVDRFLPGRPVTKVLVSGGGVHNLTLMRRLAQEFAPVPVLAFPKEIADPDGKEAVLFAMLANDRLFGHATNIPSATGAAWPVGLGKVAY